jgi:hypothetical protein
VDDAPSDCPPEGGIERRVKQFMDF